ncbi:MAG: poly-beta-1,6-N-acetyl-D-glucosamine N-deacetylase PgaB [Pseudomonadales bacterium]
MRFAQALHLFESSGAQMPLQDLAETVKCIGLKFALRNFYAETALNPQSVDWFAQSMETALLKYDYVALMAMPWMEKAEDPEQWTKNLIKKLEYLSPAQKNRFCC